MSNKVIDHDDAEEAITSIRGKAGYMKYWLIREDCNLIYDYIYQQKDKERSK